MSEHTPHPEEFQPPEQQRIEVLERFGRHPFANLETYKYFNQTGPEARARKGDFIDAAMGGETPDTPGFVYLRLDIDNLAQQRDELTEILDEVLRLDMDIEENRLLREKVTDRLHEVSIMMLTKIQSDLDTSEPIYETVSYQLGENMREVYGAPKPEHWRGILGYRLSLLSEVEQRQDVPGHVREAWEFVKERLPQGLPIEKPYQPSSETFDWYRGQLQERLAPAQAAVRSAIDSGEVTLIDDKLDGENVLKATKIALTARGITGWKVEMTEGSNLDTSQEQKTIFIPHNRSAGNMTLEDFDAVMLSHEIDEHVKRRVNGDRTGEPVLGGTGCVGYLGWEEGNGRANEALIREKIDNEDSAFDHYLNGGLALGYDRDGQGRNYGQTFDLVWRMRMAAGYLKGDLKGEPDQALRKVAERSYDKVERIFRGTDGRAPGVIFPKDTMTYYLGQAEVWRKWDSDMELPEEDRKVEHQLERSAKISPLRPDHRRVATRALRRSGLQSSPH